MTVQRNIGGPLPSVKFFPPARLKTVANLAITQAQEFCRDEVILAARSATLLGRTVRCRDASHPATLSEIFRFLPHYRAHPGKRTPNWRANWLMVAVD
jgi:hypothetical protein